MVSKFNQKTINDKIELAGVGLHNGADVNLIIKPGEPNSGISFKRIDIDGDNTVSANFKNVVEPILCTKLKNESGITVSTVEHLMAAFYGEGIDNALVEVDASEIPIMDGSAIEFVDAIRSVGIKEQSELRKFINVLKKIEVREGQKYISIEPLNNDLIVDFEIIYNNSLIRTRRKEFKQSDDDLTNIYNSRTFCLFEDIEQIKSQGLAKGGTLDNAIVVQGNRVLNEDGLRNRHEFVYHKILDCLGDLILSGHRIFGHIKTSQGGHALTNKLLVKFFSDQSNWMLESFKNEEEAENSFKNQIAIGA
ncbi:UDP-3-O-acyl-N-acetylglucosamine deacetylase [Pelagibacteraceae bacterium]|jgi:UDP-3-O-[3-hydroxymyristoyl] N-acetylglucosamine deacetylase|nr:UDP-3-O-acyl-N-acetylglucosamine deacetylase [Pelagibacteraceae bacterium]MDB9743303.1 UDP-3-O-acyl-N-acetylglucosamine deacetylase [Pelagibacteraceae bacterium]MDC0366289.1 UDP-3-O-acyl-N-acetylglucosamine deacetylase [Pelagibacteraceae bacterium]|tara:strand:- start:209 stop:1129 length:921 start_codon:yes stop_codon:yes gene_type:complete